jgi:hypothetical protein
LDNCRGYVVGKAGDYSRLSGGLNHIANLGNQRIALEKFKILFSLELFGE